MASIGGESGAEKLREIVARCRALAKSAHLLKLEEDLLELAEEMARKAEAWESPPQR